MEGGWPLAPTEGYESLRQKWDFVDNSMWNNIPDFILTEIHSNPETSELVFIPMSVFWVYDNVLDNLYNFVLKVSSSPTSNP